MTDLSLIGLGLVLMAIGAGWILAMLWTCRSERRAKR